MRNDNRRLAWPGIAFAVAGALAGCSGGSPHRSGGEATTSIPAPPATTATTAASPSTSATSTSVPSPPGQQVQIGGYTYAITVNGPKLVTQVGSRSVQAGQAIITFTLFVSAVPGGSGAPAPLTPFDDNGSPGRVHLLSAAGTAGPPCATPPAVAVAGHCDVAGVQVFQDSGSGSVAIGHAVSIDYEVASPVPATFDPSTLTVGLSVPAPSGASFVALTARG